MFYYGITIKCNKKGEGDTRDEVDAIADNLLSHSSVIAIPKREYEVDSKGKPHIHGVLTSSRPLKYTDHKVKGWHLYFKRIYSHTGWYKYVQKDLQEHGQGDDQGDDYLFI